MGTIAVSSAASGQGTDAWQQKRQQMVDEVLKRGGIQNQRVLEAMRVTPRHEFVPRNVRGSAYLDMALPIGEQQTISSPFIVAFMTECIDPRPTDRILEIGTGSGYQAAVLSHLVSQVYTIEIVESLGRRAERTLRQLRCSNVSTQIGDGFRGWPEQAPFDKIIVTCSPEEVPQPLVDQLKENGLLVIPVGERYQQTMYLFRKVGNELEQEALRPTLFVPMTGQADDRRNVQPDPAHPSLVNGSFEEETDQHDFVPGWYYQRQARRVSDPSAPDGEHYLLCENDTQGRDSHLMQGLAIDGRKVPRVELSASIMTRTIANVPTRFDGPRVVITFYDQERREVGIEWLGPWHSDQPWIHQRRTVRVPIASREAIIRVGLFGATGAVGFDNVQLTLQGPTQSKSAQP
jgi:protein-L-isoaspartate(D-aspartate) O-methyltransferase